jgi:hemolysin activation/secretion protein
LERKKIDAALTINNDGTKYVGPWQGDTHVSINNIFHLEDKLTAGFGLSPAHEGMKIFRGNYEKFLGGDGLKLTVSGNHIQTKPGDYLSRLKMEGVSDQGTLGVKYPFVRSRYQNFWVDVHAGFNNTKNDVRLITTKTTDRLRTAGITLTSDFSDVFAGKNLFELSFTKGFKGFGATPDKYINSSRSAGYTDFLKATLKALRVQALGRAQAVFLVEGQVASKSLLNAERFSMGGGPYNRAYPSGSYIGDKGIFARLELNYVFGAMGIVDHVIPYMYFTEGWAANIKTMLNEIPHETLRSVGFGVRTSLLSHLDGYVEYGIALKKKIYSGSIPSKVSMGLTVKY